MSSMLSSSFPARNLTCNFVLTFFSVAALSNGIERITGGWLGKSEAPNMGCIPAQVVSEDPPGKFW